MEVNSVDATISNTVVVGSGGTTSVDDNVKLVQTKKKKLTDKNVYYPKKTTPVIVFGKNYEFSEEVKRRVEAAKKLPHSNRITIINTERQNAWNFLSDDDKRKWTEETDKINSQPPEFGDVA